MAYDFSYLLLPEFTKLLAASEQRGWMTYSDFHLAIPYDLDVEELEDLYSILSSHGIRFVDDGIDGRQ